MFHLVRMNVSKMELSIIRKETLGTPDSTTSKSKVLEVFEVMDGCPEQGSAIPFRMCMRGVKDLAPSYQSIHNRLFVRHWLNLVIFDE
jgi:vacuolar protein sorting-associated protein 26